VTLKLIAAAMFAAFLAVTSTAPAETTPVTTETAPSAAITDRQIGATTVFETTTVEQVTTVLEPAPTATTTGVSPAAAARAGAAAATQNQSSTDSTDWGWVAFGILAAAVIGGGTVWLVRRRRPATGS
jgi:cobalamin biosynthesis Mg chelatase CobN